MFVKSGSKVLGWRRIASASDRPDSTSPRVAAITAAKFLSSSWLPRISRHCTSGRPASIITENWRVKTASDLADTRLPILPTALPFSFSFFAASGAVLDGVILVTRI